MYFPGFLWQDAFAVFDSDNSKSNMRSSSITTNDKEREREREGEGVRAGHGNLETVITRDNCVHSNPAS